MPAFYSAMLSAAALAAVAAAGGMDSFRRCYAPEQGGKTTTFPRPGVSDAAAAAAIEAQRGYMHSDVGAMHERYRTAGCDVTDRTPTCSPRLKQFSKLFLKFFSSEVLVTVLLEFPPAGSFRASISKQRPARARAGLSFPLS